MTLGFKYGRTSHALDWEEAWLAITVHAGPLALSQPVTIQEGAGWARAVFGDMACVYSTPDDLRRQFPEAKVVEFKGAFAPPPMQ